MTKRKVVFVQPIQAPYWTERLKFLARNMGLEVFLLLEREGFDSRPGWCPEAIEGVTTIVLNSQSLSYTQNNRDMGYVASGVRTFPWLLSKYLFSIKPDVVVVCNATQLLFALPARKVLGFSLSLIVEDTLHSTRNHKRLQLFMKSWLYRKADSWIPFSKDANDFLISQDITSRIYPSSWSVDCEKFSPGDASALGIRKRIVSVVAALTELKGVMRLLRAWNSIPPTVRAPFELHIAGTGPLKSQIDDYVYAARLDDVILLGQIPYDRVIDLFRASSLSVLPTLQDVYGMVVLEAMACGCPVMTTPYAGARELIDDGVNGWVADPLCEEDFSEVLGSAISDVEKLDRMGECARAKAISYDTKNVIRDFAENIIKISYR